MLVRENRHKPANWREHLHNAPARWALPFHALEWVFQWTAYFLSRWALLEVLEYLGSLSVLVAVIFYYAESGDRRKQKHYQAWQVINTAQGKGGSGGRIEALTELNEDRVPLVGVDVSGAFLMGVRLIKAGLSRSNFETADLREAILRSSDFRFANLHSANLRGADASGANFTEAALMDSDLTGRQPLRRRSHRGRPLRRRSSQCQFERHSLAETESRLVRQHLWHPQRAAWVHRLGYDARREIGPIRGIAKDSERVGPRAQFREIISMKTAISDYSGPNSNFWRQNCNFGRRRPRIIHDYCRRA